MTWTDPRSGLQWATRERLKAAHLNSFIYDLLVTQCPRFIDGGSWTPTGIVRVLGSVGMAVAALRGQTDVTPDGGTDARLRVLPTGGNNTTIDSAGVTSTGFGFPSTVDVELNIPLAGSYGDVGNWLLLANASTPYGRWFSQSSVASAVQFMVSLPPLPNGVTIKSVGALLKGAGHASLPAIKPSVALREIATTTRAATSLGAVTDTSASVGVYDALHWVDIPSIGATYSRAKEYELMVTGEASTNSVVGLQLQALRVVYTSGALTR